MGSLIPHHKIKKNVVVGYFSKIFRKNETQRASIGATSFKSLSSSQWIWLKHEASLEKVKQVVWECVGSKACSLSLEIIQMIQKQNSYQYGLYKITAKLLSSILKNVMQGVANERKKSMVSF